MKKHTTFCAFATGLILFSFLQTLSAQLPYTTPQFEVSVEKDIYFGEAVNFAGGVTTLFLDLYKPIGDDNCKRPLFVAVHGGAFVAGSRADADVVAICKEMATRGYVAASVEYRLGVHPMSNYTPYAFCNDLLNPAGINKCIYVTDTLETFRAGYRAVQDVKGAIRFLKNRHELDSTDVNNVFVGGASAGAITSLYVAYTDASYPVPSFARELEDAPNPDSDLASCVPNPKSRKRPDLGQVEGTLHQDGFDASVRGIVTFFGGMYELDQLEGADKPVLYIYHRTDDLIVPCEWGPLFPVYPLCLNPINLCQPLNMRPWIHGGCSISEHLTGLEQEAPPFYNDVLDYGGPGSEDCLTNPPGHSIVNIPLRCQNISDFFAPYIIATGNTPSSPCFSAAEESHSQQVKLSVYPNPAKGEVVRVDCSRCRQGAATLQLLDLAGRKLAEQPVTHFPVQLDMSAQQPAPGMYFIRVSTGHDVMTTKIVFE